MEASTFTCIVSRFTDKSEFEKNLETFALQYIKNEVCSFDDTFMKSIKGDECIWGLVQIDINDKDCKWGHFIIENCDFQTNVIEIHGYVKNNNPKLNVLYKSDVISKNAAEQFEHIKFYFDPKSSSCFDNTVITVGLDYNFKLKSTLERIVKSVESILNIDKKYCLSKLQLNRLAESLHKRNFQNRTKSRNDVLRKIIEIFKILQDNGQSLDDVRKDLVVYFEKNRSKYIDDIKTFLKRLKNDENNLMNVLKLAIQKRVLFLKDFAALCPEKLAMEDIGSLLELFLTNEDIEIITESEKDMVAKIKSLEEEVSKVNYADVAKISKTMTLNDLHTELVDIRKQITYLKTLRLLSIESDLFQVLTLLEHCQKGEVHEESCAKFFDKLILLGKLMQNEAIAIATIRLAVKVVQPFDLSRIEDSIFKCLNQEYAKEILELTPNQANFNCHYKELFQFLGKVLVENPLKTLRMQALTFLMKFRKLPNDIKALTNIESIITQEENPIETCLYYVKKNNKLTYTAFEYMQEHFGNKDVPEIIQEVVQQEHKIPDSFVYAFKLFLQNQEPSENVYSICRSLLLGNYLKLGDVSVFFEKALAAKLSFNDDLILTVSSAKQKGDKLPNSLLQQIENVCNSSKVAMDIIMQSSPNYLLLNNIRNPRIQLNQKLQCLESLKTLANNDTNTLRVLLVVYGNEPELRNKIFNHFLTLYKQRIYVSMSLINETLGFPENKGLIKNFWNIFSSGTDSNIDWNLIYAIILKHKIFVSKANFSEVLEIIDSYEESSIINFLEFLLKLAVHNERYDWYLMYSLRKFIYRKEMILKWESPMKNHLLEVLKMLDHDMTNDKEKFSKICNARITDEIKLNYGTNGNRVSASLFDFLTENNNLIDQEQFDFILTTILENNTAVLVNRNFYDFLNRVNLNISSNCVSKMLHIFFTEIDREFKISILHALQNAKVSNGEYQELEKYLNDTVPDDLLMSVFLLKVLFENCSDEKSKRILLQYYSSKLLLCCDFDQVRTQIMLFLNNSCDSLEGFNFLIALTHYINRVDKDTSILTELLEYSQENWYTELLMSTILFDVQHLQNYSLYSLCFLKNLRNLCNFATGNGVDQNEVLKKLIRKIAFETDMQYVNSFVTWLQTNKDCLQLDFVEDKVKVKKHWLESLINACQMEYTEEYLFENLFQLLHLYQGHVVESMFCKLKDYKDLNIEQLIKIFSILDMVNSELCVKEDFMLNLNCQSLDEMLELLHEFVVDVIFQYISIPNLHSHKKTLAKLLDLGWDINSLVNILQKRLKISTTEATSFGGALDIVVNYRLRGYEEDRTGNSLQKLLEEVPMHSLKKKVHQFAIHQIFPGTYDKNIQQLVEELQLLNSEVAANILKDDNLITEYKNVMAFIYEKSQILPLLDVIATWEAADIKAWSRALSRVNVSNKTEKLAVILKAVEISKTYALRAIQTLALIVLVNTDGKGRLCQINTGEGKTTVIAAFAVFKALEKHKVDIITSSSELAIPQSEEQRAFYALFNLRVAHNGNSGGYTADVLYGACSDFQGDILRDEFSQMGTLRGRKSDVAIVDEVDSMLIDGKNHIVMLASAMPMMNHTQTLLAVIYKQVIMVASSLREEDGVVYYVDLENYFNEDGTTNEDAFENWQPINMSRKDFIKQGVERHVRLMLRDESLKEHFEDSYPKLQLPVHLRELVLKKQITEWTDRAILAKFTYEEGKHYILKDNKVQPVDALNTGVVQSNTSWSFGLHEFLEIKHGCKMSVERITTNFISNVSLFKRYGAQIFGATGTLERKTTQKLLGDTYHVDSLIIPPFRSKQFYQLPPLVCKDAELWLNTVVETCLSHLHSNRAVLVITRYIKEVDDIVSLLEKQHSKKKIKEYKTQADSAAVQSTLEAGEIIVATNIAGRGTDIKLSAIVEENGGLHVCTTFIAVNERVQEQNDGRTSRTGNRGTSQTVIFSKDKTYDTLLLERNCNEEFRLTNAITEINRVVCKDNVFKEFCEYLKEIRSHNKIKFIDIYIQAIEEQFGIWLLLKEEVITKGELSIPDAIADFKKQVNFCVHWPHRCIKNSAFFVLLGNRYLYDNDFDEAICFYSKAIELDHNFSQHAYYSRGYARVAKFGKSKENLEQLRNAIEDFKESRNLIKERTSELALIQQASQEKVGNYSEQVIHKITLYNCQQNIIDEAIGIDVDQRKQEIERLTDLKKQINEKLKKTEGDSEMMKNIDTQIKNFNEEIQLRGKGVIEKALDNKHDIEIKLRDIKKILPESEEVSLYNDEINELADNGFIGPFEVKEKKPIPWCAVITLVIIGLAQMVAGAALMVYTLGTGATFGAGLLTDGIGDLITAVQDGIINRDFSWKTWGIQKVISLTISVACAGLKAMKDVAKTVMRGVKAVGSEISTVAKAGWKLAAKCMGKALTKDLGIKMLNVLAEYGIQELLIKKIEEVVETQVEKPIQDALLNNENIKMMLELDSKNRNNQYQAEIKEIADRILNKRENGDMIIQIVHNVGANLIKSNGTVGKAFDASQIITNALKELQELTNFVPRFTQELRREVEKYAKNKKIKEKYDAANVRQPSETHILNNTNNTNLDEQNDDIDLSKLRRNEKQATQTDMKVDPRKITTAISKKVSVKIAGKIKAGIISPAVTAGVSFTMTELTKSMDKCINDQLGDYKAMRRIEKFQDGDPNNDIPSEYKEGMKDKKSVKKANDMINDVCDGGELGLPHLGAASDACGRSIKVYDENGNYVRTIGSKDKAGAPIEVQYHPPNGDTKGHFTKRNNIEATRTSSGSNDCLLNVISDHTGQSPQELRNKMAENMVTRKDDYINQANDVLRLERSNKSFLQYGGARYMNFRKNAGKIINDSHGKSGHGFPNKGHPKAHVSNRDLPKQDKNEKIKNVQNYSKKSKPEHPKTAFQNQRQQNFYTHNALKHPKAEELMNKLNSGSDREILTLTNKDMNITKKNYCGVWAKGEFQGRKEIDGVTLLLQHHENKKSDKNYDVHVQTCYPEPKK